MQKQAFALERQAYDAVALQAFGTDLLVEIGLTKDRARDVAEVLVEGDLLGHDTHGLQLLATYLRDLEAGKMAREGEPVVVSDHDGAFTWDGQYLPGPWLVRRALAQALERISVQPVVSAVIRRSHHIGCLAAYLKPATDRGLMLLLTCSDPSVRSVAPHGALAPRYTPNPIACGIPTSGEPMWIDISASTTTNGRVNRLNRSGGGKLPGPWLVDSRGEASDDPAVFTTDPPGAILPLGGMDLGHKGFALGLIVEALTSGLAGFGRADGETRWGASVFLQLIDPEGFGGREAFARETGWLAQACRTAPVKAGNAGVRIPGARAMALRERQLREGVALHPEILPGLAPWAERLGVAMPRARA
jgi:LDH2 family malate/lactate/ureidoglycolate dehydrogenase